MEEHKVSGSSTESTFWVWAMVAGLLVLGAIVAFGSMAIMSWNQQAQTQTGSQPAPQR